jgi:hypothetical protein
MLLGIEQFALQRLQPATQHVRLGCTEQTTQPVKSSAISGNQVDLHRFSDTPHLWPFMMLCHE